MVRLVLREIVEMLVNQDFPEKVSKDRKVSAIRRNVCSETSMIVCFIRNR